MDKFIRYRSGYKYQLAEDYRTTTRIKPEGLIVTDFIDLDFDGNLTIKEGYAWDGPSGPTWDTPDSMRGSLEHDAKYQLLRMGLLHHNWRVVADEEFKEVCLKDGMSSIRANAWYLAVREFADSAADPRHERPVMVAP